MVRSALVLCAGILVAVCFACALPPSPAMVGPPGPPKILAFCLDGSAFHSHVAWLSNFDASNGGNPVKAPKAANITPLNPMTDGAYISDLDAAFSLAPPAFRRDLCGLDGIYLDTTDCPNFASCFNDSWGYRLRDPNYPQNKGRYVAIPKSLWSFGGGFEQYTYRKYESDLLYYTFGWTGDPAYNPTYVAANPEADTFPVTILAALAHETGHVRWYDIVDAWRQGRPDYSQVNAGCDGNDFFVGWAGRYAGLQNPPPWHPPKWRYFLTRSVRHGLSSQKVTQVHASDPQTNDIDAVLAQGDIRYPAWALDQLYSQSWPWATYYASVSPDEDFVESYKFNVLTQCTFSANGAMDCSNALLKSLKMQINGYVATYNENIPDDFVNSRKSDLKTKIWCVATVPPFVAGH